MHQLTGGYGNGCGYGDGNGHGHGHGDGYGHGYGDEEGVAFSGAQLWVRLVASELTRKGEGCTS